MRVHALAALVACGSALAQAMVRPLPPGDMQPGYGVVEQVTPVRVREASAAAGGSSAAPARPVYRLKVRMADGSVQYRDLDRPEFRAGERVLLTNAGDVLPDWGAGDATRGSTPPGTSQDGSRPAEGAIRGGTAGTGRLARCYQLDGSLREQCLADQARKTGAGTRPPSGASPARRD